MGSNTVHLLVVDAHPGARPLPAHSHKADLRLAELLEKDAGERGNGDGPGLASDKNGGSTGVGTGGAISEAGIDRLIDVIRDALQAAEDKGCEDVLPFATSAVREAANADAVLARVHQATG
ncbi:hypothetical protein ADK38_40715, partial [Streptomyces varsoviensis]